MNGRFFVVLLLFVMGTIIGLLVLFNFFPPAGNSPWTLLGVLAIAVLAWFVARRASR